MNHKIIFNTEYLPYAIFCAVIILTMGVVLPAPAWAIALNMLVSPFCIALWNADKIEYLIQRFAWLTWKFLLITTILLVICAAISAVLLAKPSMEKSLLFYMLLSVGFSTGIGLIQMLRGEIGALGRTR